MVDYSKWDKIDLLSDDSDEGHPNIDKESLKRWKKIAKIQKKEQEAKEEEEERVLLQQLLEQVKTDSSRAPYIEQLQNKLAQRERTRKVDEDHLCKEGFSKTIISKKRDEIVVSPPKTEDAFVPLNEIAPKSEDDNEKEMDEFVEKMEILAQTFNKLDSYDEMYTFIGKHPELVCEESVSYFLLHCSNCIKRGLFSESKKFLKSSQVIEYGMKLGKDGIFLFFKRMRDPSGKYLGIFENELSAYWERVKVKVLELQAKKLSLKEKKKQLKMSKGEQVPDDINDISTDDEYFADEEV